MGALSEPVFDDVEVHLEWGDPWAGRQTMWGAVYVTGSTPYVTGAGKRPRKWQVHVANVIHHEGWQKAAMRIYAATIMYLVVWKPNPLELTNRYISKIIEASGEDSNEEVVWERKLEVMQDHDSLGDDHAR